VLNASKFVKSIDSSVRFGYLRFDYFDNKKISLTFLLHD